MFRRLAVVTLSCVAVLYAGACASAGKRLEQGVELESEGRYREAAFRYVDALEKDDTLSEARGRLRVAVDSVVVQGLRSARTHAVRGEAVRSAEAYLSLDEVMAKVRGVGIQPTLPGDFARERRDALDGAIQALMDEGAQARSDERWEEGRNAYQRILRDFEPDAEQAGRTLAAQSDHLVAWATAANEDGRHQAAFQLAASALELNDTAQRTVHAVTAIQEEALARGTRLLVTFPVSARAQVGSPAGAPLATELSDMLELEYWRRPPPFVAVADPVVVRQAIRRRGNARRASSPAETQRVLDDLGADFGALVELSEITQSELGVRRSQKETRTRKGQTVHYFVEKGRVRYEGSANVIIIDDRGNEIAEFQRRASHTGRFERGVYEGNVANLELSRNEARLFDRDLIRQQYQVVEEALLAELAQELGPAVFSRVLSRIP